MVGKLHSAACPDKICTPVPLKVEGQLHFEKEEEQTLGTCENKQTTELPH